MLMLSPLLSNGPNAEYGIAGEILAVTGDQVGCSDC